MGLGRGVWGKGNAPAAEEWTQQPRRWCQRMDVVTLPSARPHSFPPAKKATEKVQTDLSWKLSSLATPSGLRDCCGTGTIRKDGGKDRWSPGGGSEGEGSTHKKPPGVQGLAIWQDSPRL